MFFSRLRRHAKWMFVFLALVFAVGFVGFGIGANQNASLGDLFRGEGGTTSGNLSVGDAREQLRENPKSAEAKRDLATALQEDGQTAEAITVLPFDAAIGRSDDFARRIARNTHAVLHDESSLARVVDAAGVFIMKNFFESIPVSVESGRAR